MAQKFTISMSQYAVDRLMKSKPKGITRSEWLETLVLEAMDVRVKAELLKLKNKNGLFENLTRDHHRFNQIYNGHKGLII